MITTKEAAEKWGISLRRVQDYCKTGKIEGAQRFGTSWMVPKDAVRPSDGRMKSSSNDELQVKTTEQLLKQTPFLYMTNLYSKIGGADECIEKLSSFPQTQILFEAEIAYSRGEIDKVTLLSRQFVKNNNSFYGVLSAGLLLSFCAVWKGDIHLWEEAKKIICEVPCTSENDRDIITLTLAAADSSIRNTKDFPDWFMRGCFDRLHSDAYPAARVYYIKNLLISAQELALGNIELEGVVGLGLMRTLPYIIEPMISLMVVDKIVIAEIYLRLICAIAYHQYGDDEHATQHLDKAIEYCIKDGLYTPLITYRRQLGSFLDDRLAYVNPEMLKIIKDLHKQYNRGWTKLHNIVLEKKVHTSLTVREREVARLASYKLTDAQIAEQLHISLSAVKSAIKNAKNKTGVDNRRDLVTYI